MVKRKVKVGANLIELDFDACTMDEALVRRRLQPVGCGEERTASPVARSVMRFRLHPTGGGG
jgi:hypothetical protein